MHSAGFMLGLHVARGISSTASAACQAYGVDRGHYSKPGGDEDTVSFAHICYSISLEGFHLRHRVFV